MAIPRDTRLQLIQEGISSVDDLAEFDNESLKQIAENLRRPTGRIDDPNPTAPAGATIPTPPFVFGAKSQIRLRVSAELVRYYQTVGQELSAANMQWNPIGKKFQQHWKALEDRKKDDTPDTPKITKSLPIIKWTEAFADHLSRVCGARTIPLSYVIRQHDIVPAAAPPLINREPYSEEHGSVEDELVACASHNHPLFRDDNAQVYYLIEEATRSTAYAASIKPFQRRKDGRGSWNALIQQYAGDDKWRLELKRQDDLLHNRKWRGQNNYSLERFIAQHRNAYVSMSQCADHVAYQLPNELTRVTFLLDAIECNDAPLQAAMALVRNDTGPGGKMNDFESTASFLVPHCPVARKRADATPGKRTAAEISATSGNATPKSGIGKTGVHLRFHTTKEYKELTPEQKQELREYRDSREKQGHGRNLKPKDGKGKSIKPDDIQPRKRLKTMVAEAVAAELKQRSTDPGHASNTSDSKPTEEQLRQYMVSLLTADDKPSKDTKKVTIASTEASAEPPVSLRSILKSAKRGS